MKQTAKPSQAGPDASVCQRLGSALAWIFAGAAFVALAYRQNQFVDRNAVNVMFWDQWDFYLPLFHDQGWWATFFRQHGPHRQGAGFLITRALAAMTNWNSRADAFGVSYLIIAAAVACLVLLRKFEIRNPLPSVVAVALIFFSVHQYEDFVGASNLSHGAMPILLIMLYCLAWFLRDFRWRLACLGILTFLLVFTGFGLFVGVITPVIALLEAVQAWRAGEKSRATSAGLVLLAAAATWTLFAHNYHFDPAAANFRFPYEKPLEYFVFVGRMLACFFSLAALNWVPLVVGLVFAAILTVICVGHGLQIFRRGIANEPKSTVIFFLTAYTLIYCANTAIGRVMLGPNAPMASRYITLLIPGALAILLQIAMFRQARLSLALAVLYTLALIPATTRMRLDEQGTTDWLRNGKKAWKAAYLQTHNQEAANKQAGFMVYPTTEIGDRLNYLEDRHLNLFIPYDSP